MTFMASIFGVALAWALLSGQATWLRRQVSRSSEPVQYWVSVALCALMALAFLSLGPVR